MWWSWSVVRVEGTRMRRCQVDADLVCAPQRVCGLWRGGEEREGQGVGCCVQGSNLAGIWH